MLVLKGEQNYERINRSRKNTRAVPKGLRNFQRFEKLNTNQNQNKILLHIKDGYNQNDR